MFPFQQLHTLRGENRFLGTSALRVRPQPRSLLPHATPPGPSVNASASVVPSAPRTDGTASTSAPLQNGNGNASAAAAAHTAPVFVPEDYTLPSGELSTIKRDGPLLAQDVFRCSGCVLPECQGSKGCHKTQWRLDSSASLPLGYLKEILTARVYDVAVQSPLEKAARLSETFGNDIYLKREDMQPVFSFKLRGAYNKMANLTEEELARGVICSSAGNHAQGVALGASRLGVSSVICMPVTTPDIKVSAVKRLGGQVVLEGETYSDTQGYAQARAAKDGRVFVAPYDDPYVIAGQGTIGNEIFRQIPNLDDLYAIFVAIGGGGLVAGIAAYVKALKPEIKVIGVEPTGSNAMALSLREGERVQLSRVDAFADGVAVKYVGAETFRLCKDLVDGVVLVSNSEISAAIKDVFNDTRSILEPAGAVSLAGCKAYLNRYNIRGKKVVAVTSGANMNFERLRLVSELADVGARKEAMLFTAIPEVKGSFRSFVETAFAHTDLNVTEVKYRYAVAPEAFVLHSVAIKSDKELAALKDRLDGAGYRTMDLSKIEAAQVHLRHMVGGRARSYMGSIPDEHILVVEFPERPGALRRFLDVMSPWNITLFHYRNSGAQTSSVMLGLQMSAADASAFDAAKASLAPDFVFRDMDQETKKAFEAFIQ